MIQTVLGEISKDELGIVLPHEHILVGFIEDGKMTRMTTIRGKSSESCYPI